MERRNGGAFTGRPGASQLSKHMDRSAGTVQCSVGLYDADAEPQNICEVAKARRALHPLRVRVFPMKPNHGRTARPI